MSGDSEPVSSKNGGSSTIKADYSRDSSCEGFNFDLKSSPGKERFETNSLTSGATNSVEVSTEHAAGTSKEVPGAESNSKGQIRNCTLNGCASYQEEGTEQNSTTMMADIFANEDGECQNSIPTPEEHPMLHSVKYLEKHQILRLFQVRFPVFVLCLTANKESSLQFQMISSKPNDLFVYKQSLTVTNWLKFVF